MHMAPVWGAFLFAGLLCSAAGHGAVSTAPSGARVALVIGNSGYSSASPLRNAVNDARDVCKSLAGLNFQTTCVFDVRSRVQMRAILQDFVEAIPDGAVTFIYYAGHAVQINGTNLLVPTAAVLSDEPSVIAQSVELDYLMRELRRSPQYLNVIVLDACRNDPGAAGSSPPFQDVAQVTDVPDSTLVFYATASRQVALDGAGEHGVMTKNLLAKIRSPGNLDDLFNEVSKGVQSDAAALGITQVPAKYSNFNGQFCLAECTRLENLMIEMRQADGRIAELSAGSSQDKLALQAERTRREKLQKSIDQLNQQSRNVPVPPPAF